MVMALVFDSFGSEYISVGDTFLVNVERDRDRYRKSSALKNSGHLCIKENDKYFFKLDAPEVPTILNKKTKESVLESLKNSGFKGELFNFQLEDVVKALNNNRFMLCHETGLGKTIMSIAIMSIIHNEEPKNNPDNKKILVVAPKEINVQWIRQICKFSNLTASKFGDADFGTTDVQLITYSRLRNFDISSRYLAVFFDEANHIKNHKSIQTKMAYKINATYKYILTATPIKTSPIEIYSLTKSLDLSGLFFENLHVFLTEFALYNYSTFAQRDIIVGYRNIDEIKRRIRGIMCVRKKTDENVIKDIGQKFEFIDELRSLKQSKFQKIIQSELDIWSEEIKKNVFNQSYSEEEMVLSPEYNEYKTLMLPILTLSRLNAISPYYAYTSTSESAEKLRARLPSIPIVKTKLEGKFISILNILQEIEGKVVVFTNFEKIAKDLQNFLLSRGISNILVTGKTENNHLKLDEFVSSPTINVLISTDVLKFGIDLQVAKTVVNLDIPTTYSDYIQRIGRVSRIGQNFIPVIINIITEKTFDERMLEIINKEKEYHEIITS